MNNHKRYTMRNTGLIIAITIIKRRLSGVVIRLILGLTAVCLPVFAGEGLFLLGNDALQLGRASSGVASPRSAYWSYMNPASMVDLERRLDINWYSMIGKVVFEPRGVIGNRLNNRLEVTEMSHIVSGGAVWPVKSGAIGGGIFIPSGSGIEYPYARNIFTRLFQGNRDRRQAYQHIRGVLAYAHEFDNGWALGLGVHLSLSRFRSDHFTLGMRPAAYNNKWDNAFGAGISVGVYRSWERFSVGANYSPRHWTQSMKKYRDLLYHPMDTPQVVQAGIAYKVSPDIEIAVDYRWMNWQEIGVYGAPIIDGGYNWRDQHGVRVGVEWNVHPRWTLLGGYAYSNSPITENNVFTAALAPATTEQHFTAGLSHAVNEKHRVHLVGVYAPSKKLRDTGRGGLFSWLAKGSTINTSGMSAMIGYSFLW